MSRTGFSLSGLEYGTVQKAKSDTLKPVSLVRSPVQASREQSVDETNLVAQK